MQLKTKQDYLDFVNNSKNRLNTRWKERYAKFMSRRFKNDYVHPNYAMDWLITFEKGQDEYNAGGPKPGYKPTPDWKMDLESLRIYNQIKREER